MANLILILVIDIVNLYDVCSGSVRVGSETVCMNVLYIFISNVG